MLLPYAWPLLLSLGELVQGHRTHQLDSLPDFVWTWDEDTTPFTRIEEVKDALTSINRVSLLTRYSASSVQREVPRQSGEVSTHTGNHELNKRCVGYVCIFFYSPELIMNDIKKDLEGFRKKLLPGLAIQSPTLVTLGIRALAAALWFGIFFRFIYVSDRHHHLPDIEGEDSGLANVSDPHADMVLVFHNPAVETWEGENEISISSLRQLLSITDLRDNSNNWYKNLHQLIEPKSDSESPRSGISNLSGQRPSLKQARTALLQDLFDWFHQSGFTVKTFHTGDEQSLCMCASLLRQDATVHYMDKESFQVQLSMNIVNRLDVRLPHEEPAMLPYVHYDKRVERRLHAAGCLSQPDPLELYRSYDGDVGRVPPSLLCSADRIKIIYNEVIDHLDLHVAKSESLLLDWYPVHNFTKLHWLGGHWNDWRHIRNCSFKQPIHTIYEIFGSRISFAFAFQGLYSKAILALVPLAVFYELGMLGTSRAFPGYSLMLVMWARIAWNIWQREQDYLIKSWYLDSETEAHRLPRHGFMGTLGPSAIYNNMSELQYPAWKLYIRTALSYTCTGLCCFLAALAFLLPRRFAEVNLIMSIMLSLQINASNALFGWIAEKLTEFENHRWESTHYSSFMCKEIAFHFVNDYFPFVWLATQLAFPLLDSNVTTEAVTQGLVLLRHELSMTLTVLSIGHIFSLVFAVLSVRLRLWNKGYIKAHDSSTFLEKQSFREEYDYKRQCWCMLQPVVSLGHVMLFGTVAPIAVPLCLLVFLISRYTSVIHITTYSKRPLPYLGIGIGPWQSALKGLMHFGVFITGSLLTVFGDAFVGTPLITKTVGLILFSLSTIIIWGIVDAIVPPNESSSDVLTTLRNHVKKAVRHVGMKREELSFQDTLSEQVDVKHKQQSQVIRSGRWHDLPQLPGAKPLSAQSVPVSAHSPRQGH